jgi:hypothetical protein
LRLIREFHFALALTLQASSRRFKEVARTAFPPCTAIRFLRQMESAAMSRQNPFGFAFSTIIEIAAIVVIVSFLPRIDLRPKATASDVAPPQASYGQPMDAMPNVSRAGWTSPNRISAVPASRETSYYERRPQQTAFNAPSASPSRPEAPPLIDLDPSRANYVEQRLDRASQQLVNSVGSAVANAADNVLSYQRPATPTYSESLSQTPLPSMPSTWSSAPNTQLTIAPPPAPNAARPSKGSFATQPRPWIRY